jgi:regulatory subunit for Cdc7p protein kinase
MAAVSLSPVPHSLSAMSGRRAPLASNPNAVNSPYRAVASAAAAKQKRSHAVAHREDSYAGQPPAKKQMLDSQSRTPPRQHPSQVSAEGRVFTRKSNAPTAFERSCVAASQKSTQQAAAKKIDKPTDKEGLDSIRQWQRHIRRSFPGFVFYFESVSEDFRLKCTKQVTALGAVSCGHETSISLYLQCYSVRRSSFRTRSPMLLLLEQYQQSSLILLAPR